MATDMLGLFIFTHTTNSLGVTHGGLVTQLTRTGMMATKYVRF